MGQPLYSFVIPVFNEQDVLPELQARLTAVMATLDGESEVIFVDDGSRDGTYRLLRELHAADSRFKVIRLARNFGQQVAMTAGLDFALGDAVIVMDADLQDPPELVPELAKRWREGYDLVYAVRARRQGDTWLKRVTAAAFSRLLRRLTKLDIPLDVGDFRLIDRRAVDAFRSLPERTRWLRGMFGWIGFRQIGVPYERPARYAGESKYSWLTLLRIAVDGIISFSDLPLRLTLTFGFLISALSFVLGVFAITAKLAGGFAVPGWASLVMVVSFLGGVQLVVIGVMGLYVGRIYEEVKARPLYIVRHAHGLGAPNDVHEPALASPRPADEVTVRSPRVDDRE